MTESQKTELEALPEDDRAILVLRQYIARQNAYIASAEAVMRNCWPVVVKAGDELLADAISDLLDRRP